MLAMNYRGPHRVRIDREPMPEILHPQGAIVRVTRSCICGSDLHFVQRVGSGYARRDDLRARIHGRRRAAWYRREQRTNRAARRYGGFWDVDAARGSERHASPRRVQLQRIELSPLAPAHACGPNRHCRRFSRKRVGAQSGDTIDRSWSAACSCEARCCLPRSSMCAADEARGARSGMKACCVSQASRRTGRRCARYGRGRTAI